MVGFGTRCSRSREREGNMTLSEAVGLALKAGCRLLDCSPGYGGQSEVGSALREALDSGVVRRDRLFVMSTLGGVVPRETGGIRGQVRGMLAVDCAMLVMKMRGMLGMFSDSLSVVMVAMVSVSDLLSVG